MVRAMHRKYKRPTETGVGRQMCNLCRPTAGPRPSCLQGLQAEATRGLFRSWCLQKPRAILLAEHHGEAEQIQQTAHSQSCPGNPARAGGAALSAWGRDIQGTAQVQGGEENLSVLHPRIAQLRHLPKIKTKAHTWREPVSHLL